MAWRNGVSTLSHQPLKFKLIKALGWGWRICGNLVARDNHVSLYKITAEASVFLNHWDLYFCFIIFILLCKDTALFSCDIIKVEVYFKVCDIIIQSSSSSVATITTISQSHH
jgi:hypothetical protein